MDILSMKWIAAAGIFQIVMGATASSTSSLASAPEESQHGAQVAAVITTEKASYRREDEIVIKVHVKNQSERLLYMLKEPWSGAIWIDRSTRRIVVAHYAFTRAREHALRGGWTTGEAYDPEFYPLAPGREVVLSWSLGKWHEPGDWGLEGKVSVVDEISRFAGLEGTNAAEAIAERDILIPCTGDKKISVIE